MNPVIDVERDPRRDLLFLAVLVAFAAVLHVIFQFGHLYGEHDAARFVVDGALWAKAGIRSIGLSEYRYFVSPGFIYLSKLAYQLSILTRVHPEVFLDVLTNVMAVALFVPAYLMIANILGPTAAFIACLYLEFIPAYWFAGLYGFPTEISFFFLVLALYLWDRYLCGNFTRNSHLHIALIVSAAVLSALLKIDVWTLSIPGVAGLVLIRRGWQWKWLIFSLVAAIVAVGITYALGYLLVQDAGRAAEYASQWNKQFSPGVSAAVGPETGSWMDELRLYEMSFGLLTLPLTALGCMLMALQQRWNAVIAIAIWLPATFVFWAWRPGDTSRHHVAACIPIVIAIAYLAGRVPHRFRHAAWIVIVVAIAVDFVRYRPSPNTAMPSGCLFASAILSKAEAAHIQRLADNYVNSHCGAVLLGSSLTPYAEATIVLRAGSLQARPEIQNGFPVRQFDYTVHGAPCSSTNVRVLQLQTALEAYRRFRAQGRAVYSYEYDLGPSSFNSSPAISQNSSVAARAR